MTQVNIAEMMDAGAHFGHQTRRWNPKMKPFIYGARSGVHIIDLQKTKDLAQSALDYIKKAVADGKDVLFVGTKPQAREVIKEQAARCNMFYVTDRWMGGTLTNYSTIKKSIDKLIDFETRRENDGFEGYKKKELLEVDRTISKLEASLGGIKSMKGVPGIIFVVDPKLESIAIKEANKLNLPVVAMVDSNCDPDPIDYPIPANDDAIASIAYFASKLADACLEGLESREEKIRKEGSGSAKAKRAGGRPSKRRVTKASDEKSKSYVAKGAKEQKFEGEATGEYSAKIEAKAEEKTEEAKAE